MTPFSPLCCYCRFYPRPVNLYRPWWMIYPITPSPHSPIYHTGDLVRWLKDGNIDFLGRIDFQVKVRGFRIELGEIESCLLKYPGTREAVVIAKEHENGSHYLCAYVVSGSNSPVTVSQLREHLLKELHQLILIVTLLPRFYPDLCLYQEYFLILIFQ